MELDEPLLDPTEHLDRFVKSGWESVGGITSTRSNCKINLVLYKERLH
jgi:hypothetical protein